jgi:hypothetical protein
VLGFPIRTSSDHSSVDSSPRLIAASYVLHRLLVPRHPPCALKNLNTKMLASTVQFSNNNRNPHPHAPANTGKPAGPETSEGPRKKQTTRERTKAAHSPMPVLSGPNSVPTVPHPPTTRSNSPQQRNGQQQPPKKPSPSRRTRHCESMIDRTSQRSTRELHHRTFADEMGLNPQ